MWIEKGHFISHLLIFTSMSSSREKKHSTHRKFGTDKQIFTVNDNFYTDCSELDLVRCIIFPIVQRLINRKR